MPQLGPSAARKKTFFNSYLKNDEAYHLKKKKNDLVQNARRRETAKVQAGGPRQHTHASSMEERKPAFQEVVISVG